MLLLGESGLWAWFLVPFQLHVASVDAERLVVRHRSWLSYTSHTLLQRYPRYAVHPLSEGLHGQALNAWYYRSIGRCDCLASKPHDGLQAVLSNAVRDCQWLSKCVLVLVVRDWVSELPTVL